MKTINHILYSFRRCPYAMRARMSLYISKQHCELREVVLRDKPSAMIKASQKATVPVLVLANGEVLEESLDIMLWALNKADPQGWLAPESGSQQEMLNLIAQCDDEFKHHLDRYKYATRYDGAVAEDHRDKAVSFLQVLEKRLTEALYLHGSKPALADYAIMPFVRQFSGVQREWFANMPLAHVRDWLEGLLDASPFKDVMKKYPQWHEGDVPLFFPPDAPVSLEG